MKDSLSNLRGIPDTLPGKIVHDAISAIWNGKIAAWKRAGHAPTRSEIEAVVRKVDEAFGAQFLPPVP